VLLPRETSIVSSIKAIVSDLRTFANTKVSFVIELSLGIIMTFTSPILLTFAKRGIVQKPSSIFLYQSILMILLLTRVIIALPLPYSKSFSLYPSHVALTN